MAETITRAGAVIPVTVRTARKLHACNDCTAPIEPGDRYERSVYPPHSIDVYDLDHWVTWRNHYPRFGDDGQFLPGCAEAEAYQEHRHRELAAAGLFGSKAMHEAHGWEAGRG